MKHYLIYIKSHAEAPDYERECNANSKEEAAKIFEREIGMSGGDWYWKDLLPFISEGEDL